jgi:hypothetical protein
MERVKMMRVKPPPEPVDSADHSAYFYCCTQVWRAIGFILVGLGSAGLLATGCFYLFAYFGTDMILPGEATPAFAWGLLIGGLGSSFVGIMTLLFSWLMRPSARAFEMVLFIVLAAGWWVLWGLVYMDTPLKMAQNWYAKDNLAFEVLVLEDVFQCCGYENDKRCVGAKARLPTCKDTVAFHWARFRYDFWITSMCIGAFDSLCAIIIIFELCKMNWDRPTQVWDDKHAPRPNLLPLSLLPPGI